ncbi:MAG TPA: adenylate/guanylate cyclase domain-containing protein [Longimicrobium sp.]
MIRRFWNWYQALGLRAELAPGDARYVRALNGIVLIATVVLWSQLPLIVHILPASRFILAAFLAFPLLWQGVPLLNHRGRHTAARLCFSLSSIVFVASVAVQLGPETENHLFMMAVVFGAFIIYPPRQFGWILAISGVAAAATAGLELFYRAYGGLGEFPREFVTMSRWSSMSTLFMMTVAMAIYHYRVVVDAELRLEREHRVSEGLLLNILPAAVAARLKTNPGPIADRIESASILFADIIGFTPLANRVPHERLVEILNTLFTEFDRIADRHGLEKIKTIGDAYMLAGGVPAPVPGHHAALARCALEMLAFVRGDPIPEHPGLGVRIGIHTGPVVAGVICERKFAYDLWGDTVNTASRMESHGLPNRIQVSPEFHAATRDEFRYEARGEVAVKGKGMMRAYLLEDCLHPVETA